MKRFNATRLSSLCCLILCSALFSCESDIGKACSVSDCDIQSPPDNANSICEPASSCDSFICVAQGLGLASGNVVEFCTGECSLDSDCPGDLSCLVVAEVGLNAGRKLCLRPQ